MIDIRILRANPDQVRKAIELKKFECDLEALLEIDRLRRVLITRAETARAKQKKANAEMAKMGNFSEEFKEAKKDRQKLLDAQERNKNESLRMEEASLDLEKNKVKRDRAQELITEENKREQKWHGRMMLKGLGKLEGALTNSFKKVGNFTIF